MHDIKFIRNNPQAFDQAMARRGLPPVASDILSADEYVRHHKARAQELLAERNRISKEIGASKGVSAWAEIAKAKVREINAKIEKDNSFASIHEADLNQLLAELPNILDTAVPDGIDDTDNRIFEARGVKRQFRYQPRHHAELGEPFGLDAPTGASLSGPRFTFLRGDLARLHRAVGQFMIDTHTRDHGFTECVPPVLVKEEAMFGTDKLPKFAADSFKANDGFWLIPTGEVPLTASVMGMILTEDQLPMRMTALTVCFRSEAGAAGRDTRGLIRQHQFEKCELVTVTTPEDSERELEYMTQAASNILDRLGLHYRRVLLCAGDTGFGAAKTYDLEVWMPGMDRWVEVASCSNTRDFQARRMNTRYKAHHKDKAKFVHTLNASGLAVGRTVAAILENFQLETGNIIIPTVLRPYMGGQSSINIKES